MLKKTLSLIRVGLVYINDVSQLPRCDVIILALKTSQNPVVLPHLKQVSSADTRIITLHTLGGGQA